jgi:hypothetical protein
MHWLPHDACDLTHPPPLPPPHPLQVRLFDHSFPNATIYPGVGAFLRAMQGHTTTPVSATGMGSDAITSLGLAPVGADAASTAPDAPPPPPGFIVRLPSAYGVDGRASAPPPQSRAGTPRLEGGDGGSGAALTPSGGGTPKRTGFRAALYGGFKRWLRGSPDGEAGTPPPSARTVERTISGQRAIDAVGDLGLAGEAGSAMGGSAVDVLSPGRPSAPPVMASPALPPGDDGLLGATGVVSVSSASGAAGAGSGAGETLAAEAGGAAGSDSTAQAALSALGVDAGDVDDAMRAGVATMRRIGGDNGITSAGAQTPVADPARRGHTPVESTEPGVDGFAATAASPPLLPSAASPGLVERTRGSGGVATGSKSRRRVAGFASGSEGSGSDAPDAAAPTGKPPLLTRTSTDSALIAEPATARLPALDSGSPHLRSASRNALGMDLAVPDGVGGASPAATALGLGVGSVSRRSAGLGAGPQRERRLSASDVGSPSSMASAPRAAGEGWSLDGIGSWRASAPAGSEHASLGIGPTPGLVLGPDGTFQAPAVAAGGDGAPSGPVATVLTAGHSAVTVVSTLDSTAAGGAGGVAGAKRE